MKRVLQTLALFVILAATATWFARGANRGWTKTSVPVITVDEITGIEGISYERRFVPGVEFLGGGVIAGAILLGTSFLFSRKPINQN